MNEQRLVDIDPIEFDKIIETFIDRESKDMGELDAPLFYTALENIFASPPRPIQNEAGAFSFRYSDRAIYPFDEETVELTGRIEGNTIVFDASESAPVVTHGNQVLIGGLRIIVHLRQPEPI